jgi:DNA-binding beta-propeller fold protein YncE
MQRVSTWPRRSAGPALALIALLAGLLIACGQNLGISGVAGQPAVSVMAAPGRAAANVTQAVPGEAAGDQSSLPAVTLRASARDHQAGPPLPTPPGPPSAVKVELLRTTALAPDRFALPVALAVGRDGDLYVADARTHQVQKFDREGRFLLAWGGEGTDDGQFRFGSAATCDYVGACGAAVGGGVAVDDQGAVYVADWANHRIQKFSGDGRLLARWGRLGKGDGEFFLPGSVAVDGRGQVYVADAGNHRIQRFDRDGRFLEVWGGLGRGPGEFSWPTGLGVDEAGRVWVVDGRGSRVQAFDGQGRPLAEWPTDGLAVGDSETPALAVDGEGRVYVGGEGHVAAFDDAGRRLMHWSRDWRGEGGLLSLSGLAVDAEGDVHVADRADGLVHAFRPLFPVTS